jgi:hypothetical protein
LYPPPKKTSLPEEVATVRARFWLNVAVLDSGILPSHTFGIYNDVQILHILSTGEEREKENQQKERLRMLQRIFLKFVNTIMETTPFDL